MQNNQAIYKISGSERRKAKSELSRLKTTVQMFWYYHGLDKDMCSFYNCKTESYPMNDIEAETRYQSYVEQCKLLSEALTVKISDSNGAFLRHE